MKGEKKCCCAEYAENSNEVISPLDVIKPGQWNYSKGNPAQRETELHKPTKLFCEGKEYSTWPVGLRQNCEQNNCKITASTDPFPRT